MEHSAAMPQSPAVCRPASRWPRRLLLVCLLLDGLFIGLLAALTSDERIYLRNVVFSRIVADRRIGSEAELDRLLTQGFLLDRDTAAYRDFIDPLRADALRVLQSRPDTTDAALAVAITRELGAFPTGQVCGLESLGWTVFDTQRGLGCCSDFSKSWIFYARYLGMDVREVNTLNHTTVEFFDRQLGRWVWLDPLNRVQIGDASGRPLSQFEIRDSDVFTALRVLPLTAAPRPGFDARSYEGYATAQAAVLMWRLGTNFLEIERHDAQLRRWGLSKSARQAILLSLGVQPRWLILTTLSLAAYLRALQIFVLASAALLAGLHLGTLVAWAWQLARRRRRHALPL